MEERSGVEELESWLCSLVPRAELVARMALRLRFHEFRGEKNYFSRIASLIKELDLRAEDLGTIRADAHKVAVFLDNLERQEIQALARGIEAAPEAVPGRRSFPLRRS